jgi:signal transduction histidine kinase
MSGTESSLGEEKDAGGKMIAGMKANPTFDGDWLEHELAERTAIAEHRTAQLRAFAAALTVSEHQERRRLAERLHGELQQLLTVAVMRLASAKKKLGPEQPIRELLEEVDHLIRESIDETRSLTLDLSPPILRHGTFARAMEWLAERMVETHGFRVLITTESELDVPERVKVFLFDAVRETRSNTPASAKPRLTCGLATVSSPSW